VSRIVPLVTLIVGLVAGYWVGTTLEVRRQSIATAARRATWGAKEGELDERLRAADRGIARDRMHFPAYVWKARAWIESDEEDAPEHAIAILTEGIRAAEVDHALYLLCPASLERGDAEGAELHAKLLRRLATNWSPPLKFERK
jgi:hypothetical protein